MQQVEKERKWLLATIPRHVIYNTIYHITQHYVDYDGKKIRIREQTTVDKNFTVGFVREIIYKENISKGVNIEHVIDLTVEEMQELLSKPHRAITKSRYVVYNKGFKFEIDLYKDINLVTLETELDDLETEIEWIDEIKKEIIMEVTGLKEFSNYSLSSFCPLRP